MIFVTLGSQKFQFNRLLIEIDRLIEEGKITEKVFAQTGYSDYKPKNYNTLIQTEPARCYHPHHRREEPPLRCEARLYHLMARSRDGTDTTVPCTHRCYDGLSNLLQAPG